MSRVAYGQRGYCGLSRSANAVRAEQDGLLPLTRAAREIADEVGCTVAFARRCLVRVGPSEWHHTGKYARATDYYALDVAVRMARIFAPPAMRRRVNARRTREAWQRAAELAINRQLEAGRREVLARLERERMSYYAALERMAVAAVCLEERRMREREILEGLRRNYLREPTAGRAAELRRLGVEPDSLVCGADGAAVRANDLPVDRRPCSAEQP